MTDLKSLPPTNMTLQQQLRWLRQHIRAHTVLSHPRGIQVIPIDFSVIFGNVLVFYEPAPDSGIKRLLWPDNCCHIRFLLSCNLDKTA